MANEVEFGELEDLVGRTVISATADKEHLILGFEDAALRVNYYRDIGLWFYLVPMIKRRSEGER